MAVAFDAVTPTSSAANPISFSHTTSGSDRCLVVSAHLYSPAAQVVSGATYNGVALTLGGVQESSGNDRVELWYLVNPASGANTTEVTFSGATGGAVASAISFTGVNQATPIGTFVSATATSTTPSVTATSETGGMVVDGIAFFHGGGAVAGADQTERWDVWVPGVIAGAGSTELGAASVVMDWTIANVAWAIGALPISPVAAGAAVFYLGA